MKQADNWRLDIEGFRAIAVLAVLIFHFDAHALPGGYLGVDMFLVISGFLITQMLLEKDYLRNTSRIREFFRRRFLRIFPTLLVALPLTALVFAFVALPEAHRSLFYSGAAALFGLANIYLAHLNADYFSPDSNINPFLHMWSVSLEDQFYVLYTLLLALIFQIFRRQSKPVVIFIATISIISLAFVPSYGPATDGVSFYSFPSRFWQFLVGANAYIYGPKLRQIKFFERWIFIVQICAFCFLLACLCLFDEFQTKNSDYLSFTLGTGLFLALGTNNSPLTRYVLAAPAVRRVGLLSYSLYVFHFPILKALELLFDTRLVNFGAFATYLLACYVLAELNYRFIEKPCIAIYRSESKRTKSIRGLHVTLALAASAGLILAFASLSSKVSMARTFESQLERPVAPKPPLTAHKKIDLVIMGDSHAQSLYGMFDKIGKELGFSIVDKTGSACFLTVDYIYVHRGRHQSRCMDFLAQELAKLKAPNGQHKVVFWGMRSLAYTAPELITGEDTPVDGFLSTGGDFTSNTGTKLTDLYVASLERELRELESAGQKILYLAPLPEMRVSTYRCFLQPDKSECRVPKAENIAYRQYLMEALKGLEERHRNFRVWDPFEEICPDSSCRNIVRGRAVFRDDDHISAETAASLAPSFLRALGNWVK